GGGGRRTRSPGSAADRATESQRSALRPGLEREGTGRNEQHDGRAELEATPLRTAVEAGPGLAEAAVLGARSPPIRREGIEGQSDAADHRRADGDEGEGAGHGRLGNRPIDLEQGRDPLVAREERVDALEPDPIDGPERAGAVEQARDPTGGGDMEAVVV